MTSQERDPMDDPFYGLGYTTPEDADNYRAERFARQHIPVEHAPHRTGHVRDYESDRDHLPQMTIGEVREARALPKSTTGREAVRAALREVQDQQIDEIAAGDEMYAEALRRVRDARRQRRSDSA